MNDSGACIILSLVLSIKNNNTIKMRKYQNFCSHSSVTKIPFSINQQEINLCSWQIFFDKCPKSHVRRDATIFVLNFLNHNWGTPKNAT